MTNIAEKDLALAANTVRIIAAEGVEKAKSGHPGMPMGMAELGATLWLKHLRYNPQDPKWLNRDRFVLSNGHGSMFLYTMLHLAGYSVSLNDLKSFRQWGSNTPGHPESFMTPGVEATTGPLGQGISNAVGMAIGAKRLAALYNTEKHAIIDHNIWVFTGDGCLMEGVSSEASSIAGHLGLGNLKVVYDDNHISIAGDTKLAFTEDVLKRYESYGWRTFSVDGHDLNAIDLVYKQALLETERPVIIAARTTIGKGSPNKANSHDVHGSPLGADELKAVKQLINWPSDQDFYIPKEVSALFACRAEELSNTYSAWQKNFHEWSAANPKLAATLSQQLELSLPPDLLASLVDAVKEHIGNATANDSAGAKPASTRKLSGMVLQAASKAVPALLGGSADLEPSTLTLIKGSTDIQKESFSGKNLRFGVREHGMGSIMNGLAYYGGYIPYGSTFMCFFDYMKPAVRLAALSHLPGLFIYTHDSIFLGEDGPTHQPIEHLSAMRCLPNLHVFRPADALETAVSYQLALGHKTGPSVLVLTRQDLPVLHQDASRSGEIAKGGYALYDSKPQSVPDLVFVATGSEVGLAMTVAKALVDTLGATSGTTIATRVVSMPCAELYQSQDSAYREKLIPRAAKKVVIEAASLFGWAQIIESDARETLFVGIESFGSSAPAKVLAEKFGLTPEAILGKIKEKFGIGQ